MRWSVVKSIRALDQERWDALAGAELTMTSRWHRVMEASRVAYRPRYLLAEDHRGPLAAIAAEIDPSLGSGWRNLALRRLALIVSAPYSSRHTGIVVRPGASMDCVDPLLRRLAWHERRPLLGVANVDTSDLPGWQRHRFQPRPQPPYMVLDLRSTCYEAYLERLPARARHEIRRANRRAADAHVAIAAASLDHRAVELYPLLAEVSRRHGSVVFSPDLFAALTSELSDRAVLLSATIDGQSAGFFLCFRQGTALLAVIAGLRYALAYPSSAYFALLDALVRWSTEHGVEHIFAGLSNEAQKERHGFQPRARWLCARGYP
jgi:predicted N-acyltransferase